ncbi:MAG: hypothetical protein ACYC6M_07095 [Terriglobales bacterium]
MPNSSYMTDAASARSTAAQKRLRVADVLVSGVAALAALGTFVWAWRHHALLLYGDATAHTMIARRMVDSATPGLSQWGSVWLPFPHLLTALLVWIPALWRTGAAGALVSMAAYVLATRFLFVLVERSFGLGAAMWAGMGFALNPNLLYLSAVPMTESVFLAVCLGCLNEVAQAVVAPTSARQHQHAWRAGGWALAASMTRYDGWFLMPFWAAWLLWGGGNVRAGWARAWRFAALTGIGPLFWGAYNLFYFGDILAFLRGPYSARQIYLNALRAGGQPYPGDHQLWVATVYFLKTVRLDCGGPLLLLGCLGVVALLCSRTRWRTSLWLLWLPLPWYLWAMWSGNVPIFIPQYWPHGYYNVRYGVQLLPALAAFSGLAVMAAARLVARWTPDWQSSATGVVLGLMLLTGLSYGEMLRDMGPLTYAEAVYNAPARLAMESHLAHALAPYRRGERILMFLGTYPGALAVDEIPLREVIQESNFHLWDAALARPDLYVQWVVVEQGTLIDQRVNHAVLDRKFQPVASFTAPAQHVVVVYRRR